jgi:curved DNA-binding protein CbpA
VATKEALHVFLDSLEKKSYYEILRVPANCGDSGVRAAFHDFSLLYHPDRHIDATPEIVALAAEIYKRGVEAYRCLSRAPSRERYDRTLTKGRIRPSASNADTVPPPPEPRTLEMVAGTPRGKQHAVKADRLIAIGKLEDARVQLVTACQCEPYNGELAERLQVLYEALALEPL